MSSAADDLMDVYRLLDDAASEAFALSLQCEEPKAAPPPDAFKLARIRALMAIAEVRLVESGGKLRQEVAA